MFEQSSHSMCLLQESRKLVELSKELSFFLCCLVVCIIIGVSSFSVHTVFLFLSLALEVLGSAGVLVVVPIHCSSS
jgi:hypothetical protein